MTSNNAPKNKSHDANVFGVILAGGSSRRMQSITVHAEEAVDKCLLPLRGEPLIAHVVATVREQVDALAISSNSKRAEYFSFGVPVLEDPAAFVSQGPLAGILSALDYMDNQELSYDWLAVFPGDAPNIASNVTADLLNNVAQAPNKPRLAMLRIEGKLQPLISLWSPDCSSALRDFLQNDGRKVSEFVAQQPITVLDVTAADYGFTNLNSPEDWQAFLKSTEST